MRALVALALAFALAAARGACDGGDTCARYPSLVIGCWQILERDADARAAVRTLSAYMDAGFTAFDTADIYGESEAVLGALRAAREAAGLAPPVVYTKYVTQDASAAEARRVNSQSRAALGGAPAMVQFHWWDFADGRFVDAARALDGLRAEGLLAEVGACNFDTAHLRALVDDARLPVAANQARARARCALPALLPIERARARALSLS